MDSEGGSLVQSKAKVVALISVFWTEGKRWCFEASHSRIEKFILKSLEFGVVLQVKKNPIVVKTISPKNVLCFKSWAYQNWILSIWQHICSPVNISITQDSCPYNCLLGRFYWWSAVWKGRRWLGHSFFFPRLLFLWSCQIAIAYWSPLPQAHICPFSLTHN